MVVVRLSCNLRQIGWLGFSIFGRGVLCINTSPILEFLEAASFGRASDMIQECISFYQSEGGCTGWRETLQAWLLLKTAENILLIFTGAELASKLLYFFFFVICSKGLQLNDQSSILLEIKQLCLLLYMVGCDLRFFFKV